MTTPPAPISLQLRPVFPDPAPQVTDHVDVLGVVVIELGRGTHFHVRDADVARAYAAAFTRAAAMLDAAAAKGGAS